MGLYLVITFFIFISVFILYKINNYITLFFFVNIVLQLGFFIVYFIYSLICSGVIYTSEIEYLEITPKEGVYFKNLDGYNYLINVGGKDTLVQNTEINREIEVPQIKLKTQYRETSRWYWMLRGEKEFYWVLEVPAKFYEIPKRV